MAIPRGGFHVGAFSGAAGISAPGGAFSYGDLTVYPHYYGGEFLIDTGYNDPVAWSAGVNAAEVYAARVYATQGGSIPSPGGGNSEGIWLIGATPVWAATVREGSSRLLDQRVYILCQCYLKSPPTNGHADIFVLEAVDWSLYRV